MILNAWVRVEALARLLTLRSATVHLTVVEISYYDPKFIGGQQIRTDGRPAEASPTMHDQMARRRRSTVVAPKRMVGAQSNPVASTMVR